MRTDDEKLKFAADHYEKIFRSIKNILYYRFGEECVS